jgi:hypothetical protein
MRVCQECIRAVALIGRREGLGIDTSFNAVARHREQGNDCALCGRGRGVHRAEEFVALVLEQRSRTGQAFADAVRDWRQAEDDH